MKPIKFSGTNTLQDQCWTAIRKNVASYFKDSGISTKCNRAMVVKSVSMLLIYIVPLGFLFVSAYAGWLLIFVPVIMGIGKAGIGMSVMHDGLHGSYSDKKWLNKLAGSSMYLIGSNVFNWKIQHNIYHHAYTNIHGVDEDIQSRWILRFSEHTQLRSVNKYQHIYGLFLYSLMTFSMLVGDHTQLIAYHKNGILKQHRASFSKEIINMSVRKSIYLFIMIGLPLLLTALTWWQVLAGFVIMHLVAGFIMSLVFQLAHIVEGAEQPLAGNGTITDNWAVHQIKTTSNFGRRNHILNWYAGGLNFQVEHHLFPNICHIHYKHISPIVERTALQFGIPYNMKPTLRSAVASHIRKLKELGKS